MDSEYILIEELKVNDVYLTPEGIEVDIVSLPTAERVVYGRSFDDRIFVGHPVALVNALNKAKAVKILKPENNK